MLTANAMVLTDGWSNMICFMIRLCSMVLSIDGDGIDSYWCDTNNALRCWFFGQPSETQQIFGLASDYSLRRMTYKVMLMVITVVDA